MILGQLMMGARQAKNAPLSSSILKVRFLGHLVGIRIAEIDQLLCVRLETDFEHWKEHPKCSLNASTLGQDDPPVKNKTKSHT